MQKRQVAKLTGQGCSGLILAAVSAILLQPAMVLAAENPGNNQSEDVSIRTLPPLDGAQAAAPADSPAHSVSPAPAAAPSPSQVVRSQSVNGRSNISFDPADAVHQAPNTAGAAEKATKPAPPPPGAAQLGAIPDGESGMSIDGQKIATTDSDTRTAAEEKQSPQKNGDQLAQVPASVQRQHNPAVAGTVTLRKPFKLFAVSPEPLIHNLSFRDTPVREVIAEIARRGKLNILFDRSVTGRITGELTDVTLNEAMDSILASAGLQHRVVDNNTVIVGSMQAMIQLGLNRPIARAFKLSYAHPYDVANILHASVFNKGTLPDFQKQSQDLTETQTKTDSKSITGTQGEASNSATEQGPDVDDIQSRNTAITRIDQSRYVRGASRTQIQEGVGFNNAATDPGSQQIRSNQEINTDYVVEQNGGNAIVVPDVRRNQVIVVGTAEDLQVAEDAIRVIDRRPREVHIQASLIEINNAGIRELGATLNVQGAGVSSSVMGNSSAPLNGFLQGLGSPPVVPFVSPTQLTPVSTSSTGSFSGLLGVLLPSAPQIAGVQSVSTSQSGINFLTLGKNAGGIANIATYPFGLNLSVNLLLQTNKAKVIANPSVVVVDNTESLITIASEVIHKVTSTVSLGVVTTNVELTKAGIFLNVLPRITEDGFITMRLRPQVSAPTGPAQTFGSTSAPTTVTLLEVREVISQEVRVKDGQTLVIGGLFTEQEQAQLSKVPYLAETPVLGAFFRNSLKGRNRTELMLLLTPKIVEEDPINSVSDSSSTPPLM
ncbi:MAG TPA: secretin and TonB N-terminal domain-containing protein [Planktothrix sp.]|jgi:type II secretory pathway component GspD/PulD (secretin)